MSPATLFQILRWRLEDQLRHSPQLRTTLALWHWLRSRLARRPVAQIRHLGKALGLAEHPAVARLLTEDFRFLLRPDLEPAWRTAVAGHPRYAPLLRDQPLLTRSVVLKAPADGEKGVLLNYFEYNLARVLALGDTDLACLDAHYHLVFIASWSPTDYALLGSALLRLKSPLFLQCANEAERERLTALHPRLVVLPGLACDWVDPGFYQPRPMAERRIDVLMVANWGEFKRHWEFFLALRRLPADLRVVLIGQRESGRDRAFIERLARRLGVPQQLELLESLPIEQVTELECDARVSVILSRREGGCVAAVESLFAGCALAMRADARIGSSAHINDRTGRRLRPGRIAQDLADLLAEAGSLDPRAWACANIRHDLTLQRINTLLRTQALAEGRPWTSDLAVPHWRPHPTLAQAADRDRLQPAYAELHRRFPHLVGADLMERSHR
jgi:glycosyltransferase involved in cell wall biosynthesis